MVISSTEFQQNVGFYLKVAQNGKPIQIRKSKPQKALFTISYQKEKSNNVAKGLLRKTKVLNMINELNIHDSKESGLEFQKRVRS